MLVCLENLPQPLSLNVDGMAGRAVKTPLPDSQQLQLLRNLEILVQGAAPALVPFVVALQMRHLPVIADVADARPPLGLSRVFESHTLQRSTGLGCFTDGLTCCPAS